MNVLTCATCERLDFIMHKLCATINFDVVHCVANIIAIKNSLLDYIRLSSKSNLLSFLFQKRDIFLNLKKKLNFFMFSFVPKKKKYIYFYIFFPTKSKWHLSTYQY